ncbi:MAG TPA: AMP-binding protein [Acidimicrobiia bacterium]|nr:AMP-binding protein [Acidimicrobiia bacterium]HMC80521.1 AMP-binding protein [Acidimicrobiia bacterium]
MSVRPDLVPAELRAAWVDAGHTPGVDLRTLFEGQVARHPDKVAVIDDEKSTTYAEIGAMADRIAGLLLEWGLGRGDVVAIQFPNIAEACAADLAVASIGATCLAYPVLYRHNEVRSLLSRSGAVACLFVRRLRDFDYAAMMADLRPELPALKHLAVLGDPAAGCDSLGARLHAPGPPPPRPAVAVGPHDPARIIVTSGTEAAPKMVLYSHAAIGGGIAQVLGALRPDDDTRFLLLPPLSTGFGSLGTYAALARYGVTMIVTAAFDPAAVIKLIERERVTHVLAVPTMLAMLLATGSGDADLSSLRVVGSFGAAMSEDRVRLTLATFDARFVNGYGCSDGAICMTGWDDPPEKIAQTVGRPSPAMSEIRILDDDGAELAVGDVGEVCARGPMSPLGYFESPELDELYRFDGGWVRTGDLGFFDAEGYLHIAGRKKDIIVRGGYNISPAETEAGLCKHPAIAEAACVGYPDERLGERMCAFVVLAPGADAPTLAELETFLVADGLARIKVPERLEIIDAMPLNPTGKILKRVLRARFEQAPAPS